MRKIVPLFLLLVLAAVLYFGFFQAEPASAPSSVALIDQVTAEQEADPLRSKVTRANEVESSGAELSAEGSAKTTTDPVLRLRAVDAKRQTMPTASFVLFAAQEWSQSKDFAVPLWRGAADAEGRATWDGAATAFDKHSGGGGLAVMLDGFLPWNQPLLIERRAQLDDEIELKAPPFGSVIVRVRTPRDQIIESGTARLIAWTGAGVTGNDPHRGDPARRAPIEKGVARFPFVALDTPPLRINAGWSTGATVDGEIEALHVAGEERIVDLQIGSDRVVLRLRVLDEAGAPIAGPHALQTKIDTRTSSSGSGFNGVLDTDADGVIWLEVRSAADPTCEVKLTLQAFGPGREGSAVVSATVAQKHGEVDLGDVILRRGPLLASGRVLLPDGSPAKNARLELMITASQSRNEMTSNAHLSSDEEGRFQWRASMDNVSSASQIKIAARPQVVDQLRMAARPLSVPIGSEDVRVQMEALGTIEATWAAGASWHYEEFRAVLVPEAEPPSSHVNFRGSIRKEGLQFEPQFAGRYTLRFTPARHSENPALEIADLVIEAGEKCADPRLIGIDLSKNMQRIQYELISCFDDERRLETEVHTRPSGDEAARWHREMSYGDLVSITMPPGRYDVVLAVTGARIERFQGVDAGQRVVLKPAFPLELALDGPASGLEAGELLRAVLRRQLEFGSVSISSTHFDAHGLAQIAVPESGSYTVAWVVERPRDGSFLKRQVREKNAARTIEIAAGTSRLKLAAPALEPGR